MPAPRATDATDDTPQRLLAAAEVVFAEKGFDGATVRDICTRAAANIAAIHYHFGDKGRLYVECLKVAHDCADGGDDDVPVWPAGTPPVEKLRRFIRTMVEKMHGPARPTAVQLLMREFANPSASGRKVILKYIRPKAHLLRDIIAELLPEIGHRRLLLVLFSVMGQILFYRQNRPVVELIFGKDAVDALDVEMVIDHVTRFTLGALGQPI